MASTPYRTFAAFLLNPCCTTTPSPCTKARTLDQSTVYAQYQSRLFLRPIMPPSTGTSKPNDKEVQRRRSSASGSGSGSGEENDDYESSSESSGVGDDSTPGDLQSARETRTRSNDSGSNVSLRRTPEPLTSTPTTPASRTSPIQSTYSNRLPGTSSIQTSDSGWRQMTYACGGSKRSEPAHRDPEEIERYRARHGRSPPPIPIESEPCGADVTVRWNVNSSPEERVKVAWRCNECGGRVLYKKRTPRMVQFEAK